MTDKHWNPSAYKFEFPDVPPYERTLIGMPIMHKIERVRRFFTIEILGEIQRCLNAKAELSALVLCLAAIDYLTGFHVGKQSKKADFIEFVDRYFPVEYKPFLDDIYVQLRSGLMHNLTILNPWHGIGTEFLIRPNSARHLVQNDEGKTIFSVAIFCEDIRRAFWIYIHDIVMKAEANPQRVENFERRFNKLDARAAIMDRIPD